MGRHRHATCECTLSSCSRIQNSEYLPVDRDLYASEARKHNISIASLALGILNEVPYASDPKAQGLVDAAIDIATAMRQKVLLLAFFDKGDLNRSPHTLNLADAKL